MNTKLKKDYSIQSVTMALSLLEKFGKGANEYTLSDLSELLKVNKNRVFRLLATLEFNEFIIKNQQTGGYQLGYKALSLRRAYINSRQVIRESRPALEDLSCILNETICLVSFKNDNIIIEDMVESSSPVRAVLQVGDTLSMDCSAAGRIFSTFVDDVHNKNPNSQMAEKIRETLAKGYAQVIEGPNTGVVEIAAPIRNQDSLVIGAVSVHGPTTRLAIEPCLNIVSHKVKEAASNISNLLGYCTPLTLLDGYARSDLGNLLPKRTSYDKMQRLALSSVF